MERVFFVKYSIIGAGQLAPEKVVGVVLVGQVRKGGSRVSCLGVHNTRLLRLQKITYWYKHTLGFA